MSDDDHTPRVRRPKSHWDDDRRARESAGHRRATQLNVPIQAIVAAHTADPAAPIALNDDDLTPVFDLLDRDPDDDEKELIRRSRRDSEDHATVADFVKLGEQVRKLRRELRDSSESAARELRDLLDRPPREVSEQLLARLDELERSVGGHRKLLRWVGGVALGSVLAVASFIYARGVTEGGDKVRLEHVEKAVEELRGDIVRILDRRSEAFQPAVAPDAISSATTKDSK